MKAKEFTMKVVASLRRFRHTSCGELAVALVLFAIVCTLFLGLVFSAGPTPAYGVDATWLNIPTNSTWNANFNWSNNAAPVNPDDTATFNTSTITNPMLTSSVTNESITFNPGASAFTIGTSPFTLTLQGDGIVNNSTNVQTITNPAVSTIGSTHFRSNATAGVNVAIINGGSTSSDQIGGDTKFFDTSNAGSATITNNGATVGGASGGFTEFHNTSNAGNATIVNNGGTNDGLGGLTEFNDESNAGSATINNLGATSFFNMSTAGNATINNDGSGITSFFDTVDRRECDNQQRW